MKSVSLETYLGFSPEELTPEDRIALVGKWVAVERFEPIRLPFRVIAAIGENAAACVKQLQSKGLAPGKFEFFPVEPPW